MKYLISIILCLAMLSATFTVGAYAKENATTGNELIRQEVTDEPLEDDNPPDDFHYFGNLWKAFENATVWTLLFPELLISSVILGIAGPPLAFMVVGYSYFQLIKAIGGVPVSEEFSYTFGDAWKEIKRIFFHKFSMEV